MRGLAFGQSGACGRVRFGTAVACDRSGQSAQIGALRKPDGTAGEYRQPSQLHSRFVADDGNHSVHGVSHAKGVATMVADLIARVADLALSRAAGRQLLSSSATRRSVRRDR